jgi:hypothetical protein
MATLQPCFLSFHGWPQGQAQGVLRVFIDYPLFLQINGI